MKKYTLITLGILVLLYDLLNLFSMDFSGNNTSWNVGQIIGALMLGFFGYALIRVGLDKKKEGTTSSN